MIVNLVFTMTLLKALVLCCALNYVRGDLKFPPGFKFGVASAAYQVEGGWNASDKSVSIWDRFCHQNPHAISDRSNGDVACDSYNLWRRDIEMIEEIGAHFYRFSISWTRLMPTGFPNKISEVGKKYYNDLIDGLLSKGIEPLVTLYHWDLPQSLQDLGGWTNPLIVDWFADYARVIFTLYGDRVKTWITINEPIIVCDQTYNSGALAPGIYSPEVGTYLCNRHILLAHATAWRIYDKEFRSKYHGEISLCNPVIWTEAYAPEYEELTELMWQMVVGRYSHAIFTEAGGWPPIVEKALREVSQKRGYKRSILPEFTEDEKEFIKGTFDFYGLNAYTSRLIRLAKPGEKFAPFPLGDCEMFNVKQVAHPDWPRTSSSWFTVHPEGMRKVLLWIREQYGDVKIIITENGYPNKGGIEDDDRIDYYRGYMENMLMAMKEGVNVAAYTAWTLMDNFEWTDGYQSNFGLYHVDFNSPNRTRTPKKSARFYSKIIKTHSLDFTDY